MSYFEGTGGTETILGNKEHKKTIFHFFGEKGKSPFISGEQESMYPLGVLHWPLPVARPDRLVRIQEVSSEWVQAQHTEKVLT